MSGPCGVSINQTKWTNICIQPSPSPLHSWPITHPSPNPTLIKTSQTLTCTNIPRPPPFSSSLVYPGYIPLQTPLPFTHHTHPLLLESILSPSPRQNHEIPNASHMIPHATLAILHSSKLIPRLEIKRSGAQDSNQWLPRSEESKKVVQAVLSHTRNTLSRRQRIRETLAVGL